MSICLLAKNIISLGISCNTVLAISSVVLRFWISMEVQFQHRVRVPIYLAEVVLSYPNYRWLRYSCSGAFWPAGDGMISTARLHRGKRLIMKDFGIRFRHPFSFRWLEWILIKVGRKEFQVRELGSPKNALIREPCFQSGIQRYAVSSVTDT